MTIRALKIFVTVAEEKTMHAAARKLFISQPSVSQAISELEKEYNVKLFERFSQRLHITETGEQLLRYAYHMIGIYEEMEQMLMAQGQHQQLKVGASVSVGTCMLNDIVEKMKESKPELELYVTIDNTSLVEKLILESQLDAALVEGVIVSKDLVCKKVCDDELIVVAPPDHPLARCENAQICDLAGQEIVSREPGSHERNQFEQFLQEHKIEVKRRWTCSNTQAIKNAVLRGQGLAILSRMIVEDDLKSGKLVQILLQDVRIQRDIKFVYHKDKYISEEIREFANICGIKL